MPNKNLTALLVFLLTTSFYIFTLSPSLAWGDGVRLQSEAIAGESFVLAEMNPDEFTPDGFPFSKVGVTAWDHPLYIVLGYTLTRALPFVDPLWLVNLISAIFGSASVLLVFLLCYQFTNSLWAAVYAALALAVSHTFWWHSSTPEVYTLFAFLLLLSIYLFDRFERTGNYSALTLSALSFGLAMSNHILAVLALPALLLYLLWSRRFSLLQLREWNKYLPPAVGFFSGFSLYILQFVRLSREIEISTVASSAAGSTFLNGLGAFSPSVMAESLFTYLLFLILQFGPLGIILGIIGFRNVFRDTDLTSRKIVALYAIYTVFGIFYRVTDQFAFFMTSHIFFALLMGIGAVHLYSILKERQRVTLNLILIFTIMVTPLLYRALPRLANRYGIGDEILRIPQIGTGLRNGLEYYIDPNKRGDFAAYKFGEQTIKELAPNSVLIAEWYTDTDEYFVLRHFHKVMELRPDVTIYGWATEDPFSFDPQLVLDVIEDAFPARPVYLASLSDRFYSASTLIEMYCIVPENSLYRLYIKGNDHRPCLEMDSITE
jgi:hypothetical protein